MLRGVVVVGYWLLRDCGGNGLLTFGVAEVAASQQERTRIALSQPFTRGHLSGDVVGSGLQWLVIRRQPL